MQLSRGVFVASAALLLMGLSAGYSWAQAPKLTPKNPVKTTKPAAKDLKVDPDKFKVRDVVPLKLKSGTVSRISCDLFVATSETGSFLPNKTTTFTLSGAGNESDQELKIQTHWARVRLACTHNVPEQAAQMDFTIATLLDTRDPKAIMVNCFATNTPCKIQSHAR